jgi:two-component system KDP operon response regulator KdpE
MNNERILIIEDEAAIRRLLQLTLESQGYKVIQAVNGSEGIKLASQSTPDLIVLDLGLPDLSGLDVIKILKQWYKHSIIVLSVLNEEDTIVEALDTGASDYLSKPFRSAELLARIRSAIRRNRLTEPLSKHRFGDLEIDYAAKILLKNGEYIKLTSTEFNLLSILCQNVGRVLTHRFLLMEIWGINHQQQTQYLRVFIGSLRKKIEKDPHAPVHILTISGVGYRFS